MNFSTKALEEISTIVAEETGRLIEAGEIKDLQGLENGIREMLKEVGVQSYGKVLEKEYRRLGKRVRDMSRSMATALWGPFISLLKGLGPTMGSPATKRLSATRRGRAGVTMGRL
jgi:hypothetical protein